MSHNINSRNHHVGLVTVLQWSVSSSTASTNGTLCMPCQHYSLAIIVCLQYLLWVYQLQLERQIRRTQTARHTIYIWC